MNERMRKKRKTKRERRNTYMPDTVDTVSDHAKKIILSRWYCTQLLC